MIEYNKLFIKKFIKKQSIKWNILALVSLLFLCAFLVLIFTLEGKLTKFMLVIFTLISCLIFGQASLWSVILFKENKLYKNTNEFVPNSLNKYFLFLHAKKYIFNWVIFPIYIIGIISALLMIWFHVSEGEYNFESLSFTIKPTPNLKWLYISVLLMMLVLFFIHTISLFFNKKTISDIKNQVKSSDLPSTEDVRKYEKKINRRCLITFCIVWIILLIPLAIWAWKKRKNNK